MLKHISDRLSVSLDLQSGTRPGETSARLTFHNNGNNPVVVENPDGWLSSVWKHQPKTEVLDTEVVLLGNIQLLGYVVLNYKFDAGSDSTGPWWKNSEYLDHYHEHDGTIGDKLDKCPFVLDDRMVIGGKLGGVNDLLVSKDNTVLDPGSAYFVHDLLYGFNTLQRSEVSDELPLHELTDGIVPFYATNQQLVFTEIRLGAGELRSFDLKFRGPNASLPPSYNTQATALALDNGWVSIKYLVVVSFSENNHDKITPRLVYFPYHHVSPRPGDFLERKVIDNDWTVLVDEAASARLGTSRQTFVHDLRQLIGSDLHSVSKNERRKSSATSNTLNGSVPAIPHLQASYQIRVNAADACTIVLSKPYYHIGEDIDFCIDLSLQGDGVVGVVAHLEAHEIYHLRVDREVELLNTYRASPTTKINTWAVAESKGGPVTGKLHLAKSLCAQFSSSRLFDLRYFVVFRFILAPVNSDRPSAPPSETGGDFRFRAPVSVVT